MTLFLPYNSNGSTDSDLDGDGMLVTSVGISQDKANSMAFQSDGKIVVAEISSLNNGLPDFALVRYKPNGSLDESFDSDGKLTTAIGVGRDIANSIAIQSDGKILVGVVRKLDPMYVLPWPVIIWMAVLMPALMAVENLPQQ